MTRTTTTLFLISLLFLTVPFNVACAQNGADATRLLASGKSVLPDDPLFSRPVGGLEQTNAVQETVPVTGETFTKALRVTIKKNSADTNATQLTIPNAVPVKKGEALVASFALRGTKADGVSPAEIMFLFEKMVDPWTKSVTEPVRAARDGKTWRRVSLPFVSSEDYDPGQAMASLRLAFGPQTIEIADLKLVSLGMGKSLDEIRQLTADMNPLGNATVTVDSKIKRQAMTGLGGNYCQARYGSTQKIDAVGQYTLDHLNVAVARIGLPLNYWAPEKGVYREEGQAQAAMQLMQEMVRRKIPIIASIWEGPQWLLPGKPEESGRVLSPDMYDDCIAAIVQFLVTARDKYQAPVDYLSFNEADYGVNFKFTPAAIAAFIKKAGPRFKAAGLTTRFLVGDTANGSDLAGYAAPLLADKDLAPYLGPIAFHCWDVLGASDGSYTAIADLGRQYGKQVWCTEAGHDAQLWHQPNPWVSWDNALRLATAYTRTLRLSGASTMLYWTYQDNYPLLSQDARSIYPVFQVVQMMESVFPQGATVYETASDDEKLQAIAVSNPKNKGTSVLLVNIGGPGSVTLKGLPSGKRADFKTLKNGADSNATARLHYRGGHLVVDVPARSVTVVILE